MLVAVTLSAITNSPSRGLPQPACPASRGQAQFCCQQSASASFSDDRTQVTLRYVRPSEP